MRHVSAWLGLAIVAATTLVGSAARAEPPAAPVAPAEVEPPDYPPPSTRWKVAGVGLASAGVFYGVGAGLSYAFPDVPGMKDLRIPVAGPWIAASHSSCGTDPDCSDVLVVIR